MRRSAGRPGSVAWTRYWIGPSARLETSAVAWHGTWPLPWRPTGCPKELPYRLRGHVAERIRLYTALDPDDPGWERLCEMLFLGGTS